MSIDLQRRPRALPRPDAVPATALVIPRFTCFPGTFPS